MKDHPQFLAFTGVYTVVKILMQKIYGDIKVFRVQFIEVRRMELDLYKANNYKYNILSLTMSSYIHCAVLLVQCGFGKETIKLTSGIF